MPIVCMFVICESHLLFVAFGLVSHLSIVVVSLPSLISRNKPSRLVSILATTSWIANILFQCRACKNKTACSQLYIPYAAKLLFQVCTLRHFLICTYLIL